jgi:hypothetical protein
VGVAEAKMTITGSNGNVGIGTTDPDAKLHIHGDLPQLRLSDDAANNPAWCFQGSGATGQAMDLRYRRDDGADSRLFLVGGEHADDDHKGWQFNTHNGTSALRIDKDGNIGIGVTSPDNKLEVRGSIQASYSDTDHGMIMDHGGTLRRDYGNNGAGFHFTANAIWPTDYAGTYSNGGIDFGNASYRWNNMFTESLNVYGTITCTGGGVLSCPNHQSMSLDIIGGTGFDASTAVRIKCQASAYGRNQLHLVGRYEASNDAFSATGARNAIMFKSQSSLNSGITDRWTIQSFPNGSNNDLGFMAGTNNTPKVMFRGTNGNVGIGTASPGHKLDIKANPFDGLGLLGSSSGRYSISTNAAGNSLTFTHGSYSWGNWANAHHYDVYSGRSGDNLTGARDFYLNYYSGAPVRLVNGTSVSSDDRIKTNERYITNATETLLKLKPQIYDKGPSLGGGTGETRVESGLIVQDIYYDAPELRHLVHYDEDAEIPDEKPYVDDDPQKDPDYSMWGTKSAGLNYEGFIAYLIKSNQEIYTDLQAEKAKVAKLELLIEGITTRMTEHERQTGFRM